jgi:hypothetical protein
VVTGYSSCWALHHLRRWVQFESSVLHCTKRTTSFASKNTHPLSPLSFLLPHNILLAKCWISIMATNSHIIHSTQLTGGNLANFKF